MLKVLYVEDNPIQARTGARAVRHVGGEITVVDTGEAALALLRTTVFDVILSDLMLPDINGLQLIPCIRVQLPHVPIIVLTGCALHGEREACLAAGGTDYLIKPIDIVELEKLLRKHAANLDL
ncbi:MAG: response regulator [Aggregatilineales bacterium]